MKNQIEHEAAKLTTIFSSPASSIGETIYLNDRRAEEFDPVDIPVPDEENIDPKKIEPNGNYGNNESPSNVDGTDSEPEPDDIDDNDAGDDEDTLHPIQPQPL